MKKLIFCILIFATLTACSNDNAADKPMPSKFKPVVNPHPKYFMTVKGYIAPSLLDKVKLVWETTYVTSNPKCQLTINDFEGVHAPRQVTDKLIVQPNSKGIYENKIALDKYEKGFCGWKIRSIGYNILAFNKKFFNIYPQVLFNNSVVKQKVVNAEESWRCMDSECHYSLKLLFAKENSQRLSSRTNYEYIVNIS